MAELVQIPIETIAGASDFRAMALYEDFMFATHTGAGGGSVLKFIDGEYVLQSIPAAFVATGTKTNARFTPNGKYLVVTNSAAPYLHIYRCSYDGGVLDMELLASPAVMPADEPACMDISPDGNWLVIANTVSPRLLAYVIDYANDAFVPTSFAGIVTNRDFVGIVFSFDSQRLNTLNSGPAGQFQVYTVDAGSGSYFANYLGFSLTGWVTDSARYAFAGRHSDVFFAAGAATVTADRGAIFVHNEGSYSQSSISMGSAPSASEHGSRGTFLAEDAQIIGIGGSATYSVSGEVAGTSYTPDANIRVPLSSSDLSGVIRNFTWGSRGGIDHLGVVGSNVPVVFSYADPVILAEGTLTFPSFTTSATAKVDVNAEGDLSLPPFQISAQAVELEFETILSVPIKVGPAYITVEPMGLTAEQEEAPPFTYGRLSFPPFVSTGLATFPIEATGALSLPVFTAAGYAEVDVDASGHIGFPTFVVQGEMELPENAMGGHIAFPTFTMAGEADAPHGIVGAFTFPSFVVEGEAQGIGGNGSLSFPRFGLDGDLFWVTGGGELTFPSFTVEGEAQGVGGRGGLLFPSFIMDGDAQGLGGTGHIALPAFTVEGEAQGIGGNGHIDFSALTMSGNVVQDIEGVGELSFPRLQIGGLLTRPIIADANLHLPAFTVSALTTFEYRASGHLSFPTFRVRGSDGSQLAAGGSAVTLGGDPGDGIGGTFPPGAAVRLGFGSNFTIG